MNLKSLHVINFRNLKAITTQLSPGVTAIVGPNAQGKTNLLEAVYMLSTGRSFRTRDEREIVPWDMPHYEATLIRAEVQHALSAERVLLTFNGTEKHVSVNGQPLRRLGDLLGYVNAVLFTPADLQLVLGAPAERRRFLDIVLSQTDRSYLNHLQRYDLALRQRNGLLKRGANAPLELLASFDELLALHGSALSQARASCIAKLSNLAADSYALIANSAEELLQLTYEPSPKRGATPGEGISTEQLLAALTRARSDDLLRGTTSVGPHRDDFSFLLSGKPAADYASQGQVRTCVLALRLAEVPFFHEVCGEYPIVLLDDLLGELDSTRQERVISSLDPALQVLMTATDAAMAAAHLPKLTILQMDNGSLIA